MNIIFHSNQLGIRGTEVALYDMAHYNETILGNTSYITYPANSDLTSFDKFNNRFKDRMLPYEDFSSLEEVCNRLGITHSYIIKAGYNDGKLISGVKNFVHAVFDGSQPHGECYMAISEWLGKRYNIDYLPHNVSLPNVKEDYREFLNIPKEAVVFGRYGGYEQFDVPYLPEAIFNAAQQGKYFLLMNTKELPYPHPNIIYLEGTTDVDSKTAFINTCDAMIHGRTDGESFGLAVCEFLHQNKPVITNIECRDRHHISLMKEKGFYYNSSSELYAILFSFEKKNYDVKQLVNQFSPEIVMKKFKNIFL
jgi:hypothetical protein